MKKLFETPLKLVKVLFADPADYDNRFDDDFEPVNCCVVGWLVSETKGTLRIAWLQDEIDGPSAGIAIPKGSILSMAKVSERN